jgi:hypothetical protein
MAFGDSLRPSDGASVVLHVDTSQTAKLEQAERQWAESVGTMSREALKLDLAQERLRKTLTQYGAESSQAKRATIALRDAEAQAGNAADRTTRDFQEQARALGRLTRGAVAGSGAFRGFGRMIAFASASFLGGAGFVYAIRQALNASRDYNEEVSKTREVFGAVAPQVMDFANNALGLAKDQALGAASSLGALLRPIGLLERDSAKVSVTLTKLGVDLASFYNTSVQDALDAIRSGLIGEAEPLRRYGVLLSETRVQQLAMAQSGTTNAKELTNQEKALARVAIILRDTKLAAGDYSRTIDGVANQEREVQKHWRNTQILLGEALRPAYLEILRTVNDWLGDAENQRALQERLNTVMETGEKVVRGFGGAIELVADWLRPLVELLGGAENAAKLFLLALAARKLLAITGAVRGLQLAIRVLGPTAVASSATTVASMNAIGAAAAINAIRVGTLRTALLGLGRASLIGGVVAAGAAVAVAGIKGLNEAEKAAGLQGWTASDIANVMERQSGPEVWRKTWANMQSATRRAVEAELRRRGRVDILAAVGAGGAAVRGSQASPDTLDLRRVGRTPVTAPAEKPPPRRRGGERRTLEDILLDQARASVTPGMADDVRFLREEQALLQRQIAMLEARRNKTAEQKQELTRLYQQLRGVQSELDSIAEAEEKLLADQRAKAAKRREAAREREAQRMARLHEAAARRAEARADLFAQAQLGRHGWNRVGMRRAALAGLARSEQRAVQGAAADFNRLAVEFLSGLQGAGNQFGSNIGGDWQVGGGETATNTWVTAQLTREQNRLLRELTRGVAHPGAKFARTELMQALGGMGGL